MSEYDNKVEGQLTVGLDVGDRYTHACVLDPDGEILQGNSFSNQRSCPAAPFRRPGTPSGSP